MHGRLIRDHRNLGRAWVWQRLHWRVHREACFGRSNEGQSAMEAAAKKPKEGAAEKE